jgi:ubiquinone/menaquinone biosynthesis C-methylase UbiE
MQTQAALLVGLDLSRNMLKEMEKPTRGSNMAHLVVADADHSPLRSGLFDQVFAITLLQNMPNPTQTLREMKRVAKSDGLLVVSGLRKIFGEELFLETLGNAELEVVALKSSPDLKCHLAICRSR